MKIHFLGIYRPEPIHINLAISKLLFKTRNNTGFKA